MKPKERRARIFDLIRQEGRVSVDQLVSEFDSSAETIRRDLNKLAKTGEIQKVHGGAILPGLLFGEGSYKQRMRENVHAKRLAARNACRLISPGDSLLIDTGSSTLMFAEEVAQIEGLTVITNSTQIARVIFAADKQAKIILLGGEYNGDNFETLGEAALTQLRLFHASYAVLATAVVDADAGVMSFDAGEAAVARAMVAQADRVIALADSSKFDRTAPYVVGGLAQFDYLACESEPSGRLGEALAESGVELLC